MVKIILLIISSDDLEVYAQMRELSRRYFKLYSKKTTAESSLQYFFVEFKENIQPDTYESNDYIYVNGRESICPGMYLKTTKAIAYINKQYKYDYLVRTNLSSFWNIPNLFKLCAPLPRTRYAGGVCVFGFITGTGIIMSADVTALLTPDLCQPQPNEDVLISHLLTTRGVSLSFIDQKHMFYLINNTDPIPANITDILYFRIKNPNRNNDIHYFQRLLTLIYKL